VEARESEGRSVMEAIREGSGGEERHSVKEEAGMVSERGYSGGARDGPNVVCV